MIYVTGDIHGDFSRFKHAIMRKLKKDDTLIICGDFGFIWEGTKSEQHILKKIGELKYRVLFIDGTHENFDLLEKYPESKWNGGLARVISGNLVHLMRGQVYEIEDKKIFTFGGGHSQDIEIRRESKTWYEREQPTIDEIKEGEKNLSDLDYMVDYIVTHEPPVALKKCLDVDISHRLETDSFFEKISVECKFKKWFFGKCHLNKQIPPKFHAVFDDIIPLE